MKTNVYSVKFYDFVTELYRHIDTQSLFSIVLCTSAFGSTPNNIVGKITITLCARTWRKILTVQTSGFQSPVDDVNGTSTDRHCIGKKSIFLKRRWFLAPKS